MRRQEAVAVTLAGEKAVPVLYLDIERNGQVSSSQRVDKDGKVSRL
ncbi:MAG: hypothetical protein ACRDQD_27285 [Nocardioidaceae bacterium]